MSGKTDAVSSPEICRVNIPPKIFYSNSEVIQELDDSYTLSHTESTPTQSQSSNPSVPSYQFTQPSSDSVFTELQPATIQEVVIAQFSRIFLGHSRVLQRAPCQNYDELFV